MSVPASLVMLFVTAACAQSAGRNSRFALSLAQAESLARAHSLELKSARERAAAANEAAAARFGALLPRLSVDASYRAQSEPYAPPVNITPDKAYAVGPTLSWTLWDHGALHKQWQAQKAAARSQEELQRLALTQALLGARLAYVQVALAAEQVRLLAESVGVAAAQYEDIKKRHEAGSASRIDVLASHQEELRRRKDFLAAQADLGSALRELFQLIGERRRYDLTRPVDARQGFKLPAGLPTPTLSVEVDPLARVPAELGRAAGESWDRRHPELMALQRQSEAARLSASALSRSSWGKLQLQAQSIYEYPTGRALKSVTQNTVAVSASVPLFEGWQGSGQAREQERLANALDRRREHAAELLARDWDQTQVRLRQLQEQQAIDDMRVDESEQLAKLVYASYTEGRSTYIDVQVANLSALQAKIQAAQTRAQTLIQLAQLAAQS